MAAVNVNVGVLGHVDSGKTSLVRALSTHLSTAALDKSPQSQRRGITLDLGFSSFRLDIRKGGPSFLQVTLVDCPGHTSLFQTVLGGAAIIDTVVLVTDCRKGLEAQTIESLLLASLVCPRKLVIVLTKTDLLSALDVERAAAIGAVTSEVQTFVATHFSSLKDVTIPVVPVVVGTGHKTEGIPHLLEVLRTHLQAPERDTSGDFRLAVDHCFAVPGHGTVLTGTVLSGALSKGSELELLPSGMKTTVKTLQVFRQDVERCVQGDRVGLRVNGLDPALVERALAVSPPGSLPAVTQVVIAVARVPLFQGGACKSGAKCHATVGHATVIATATFFARLGRTEGDAGNILEDMFDPLALYEYVPDLDFGYSVQDGKNSTEATTIFALLQFERAVFCPPATLVVCSRLDLDAKRFSCRLAFYGTVECVVGSSSEELDMLSSVHRRVVNLGDIRIGRVKSRDGIVDKVSMSQSSSDAGGIDVIGRDMFSKDVRWSVYQGLAVLFEKARVLGIILGPFGKTGKFRIALVRNSTTSTSHQDLVPGPGDKLVLRFVKLVTLKSPKSGGRRHTTTWRAPRPSAQTAGKASLLQNSRLLYPEAFKVSTSLPDVDAMSMDTVRLITETVLAHDEENNVSTHTAARRGRIERLKGETTATGRNPFAIVSGLFGNEHEADDAVGCQVRCVTCDDENLGEGKIERPFGKAGKVRIDFRGCGGTMGNVGDSVEMC
uniref:Elongation factor Tu, chloroplastic n=1 Tax=Hyaloperonospora arabidopsidis (strain Emoy2) TaxID=559515 RepID=M4BU65_HYAAE